MSKKLLQIPATTVITRLTQGQKVFAFVVASAQLIDLDSQTFSQIRNMTVNEADAYLFFIIQETATN